VLSPGRRVVLITGAAGAIGSATVHLFLQADFHVVGIDRDPAVSSVSDHTYSGFQIDLSDEMALATAVGAAERIGVLAHVIGIAGGALPAEPAAQHDPAQLTADVFRASVDANLTTQFLLLRTVLPWLRRNSTLDRSITFTSSFNALAGYGMPAYSAAKAGLIGLMHAVTGPLGAEGIRANVVAPGTVRTPRSERLHERSAGHFERLAASAALGRLTTPDDVARTFLAVATLLTQVTGQVVVVDGGQMIKRG
jgi:NAD(P)-dependent dehydrogenase (short-subunit alcohol dehydrogenase family)